MAKKAGVVPPAAEAWARPVSEMVEAAQTGDVWFVHATVRGGQVQINIIHGETPKRKITRAAGGVLLDEIKKRVG